MADTRRRSQRRAAALAALGLLLAACAELTGSTTVGGSVVLGQVLADEAFYDPGTGQATGDAWLVTSQPLSAFDVPDSGSPVADGSITPIGEAGDLQAATWRIDDAEFGRLDCFGFRMGGESSGAECGQPAAGEGDPSVFFELRCSDGDPPEWHVFTIAETVAALRLEVEGDAAVVGADPEGTGLVAAAASGNVSRITAQTTGGEIRLVDIEAACPAGEAGEPAG